MVPLFSLNIPKKPSKILPQNPSKHWTASNPAKARRVLDLLYCNDPFPGTPEATPQPYPLRTCALRTLLSPPGPPRPSLGALRSLFTHLTFLLALCSQTFNRPSQLPATSAVLASYLIASPLPPLIPQTPHPTQLLESPSLDCLSFDSVPCHTPKVH